MCGWWAFPRNSPAELEMAYHRYLEESAMAARLKQIRLRIPQGDSQSIFYVDMAEFLSHDGILFNAP